MWCHNTPLTPDSRPAAQPDTTSTTASDRLVVFSEHSDSTTIGSLDPTSNGDRRGRTTCDPRSESLPPLPGGRDLNLVPRRRLGGNGRQSVLVG